MFVWQPYVMALRERESICIPYFRHQVLVATMVGVHSTAAVDMKSAMMDSNTMVS